MKLLSLLTFLLIIASNNAAQASPSFSYLKSTLQSLDDAIEARELFTEGYLKTFEKERLFDLSKALDKAVIKLERAKLVIERYKESGDPLIRRSAKFFIRGYSKMRSAFVGLNRVIEQEIGKPADEISGENLKVMQSYLDDLQRIGKNLHNAAVLASYAALDQDKKSKRGGWTHILMTRSEYEELSEMLAARFKNMDQVSIDLEMQPEKAALLTLAQFFNNEWLTQGETLSQNRVGSMQLFNRSELAKLNQVE